MYDEPVATPILDLLDSTMMQQYISAAREQYNQAYKEQKDLAKEFGDLYSPSSTLNKAYYDATKGRLNDAMNYLYQNGIDPLRSAEGRAYLAKVVRETPYNDIANWKSDAENMKLYNKAAASLMAEGKYDKEYADWALQQQGLKPMDQFDPYGEQRWTAVSPIEYKSIDQISKPYGDAIKAGLLNKEDVEGLGYKYDPNNDYMGISYNRINDAADKAAQAIKTTPQGKFELQRIKSQMQAQGLNPTDADVDKAFAGKIAETFGPKAGVQAMDANKYAYAKYANDLADQLDAKKSARDLSNQLTILQKQHEYKQYEGNSSNKKTIFDIADERPNQSAGLNEQSNLAKNGVSLDKNVHVQHFPQSGEKESYTSVKFNTRDVKPIILKRGTNKMLYWKPGKSDDVEGRVLGNLTKLNDGNYYVKVKVVAVNGVDHVDKDNEVNEFWLRANKTVNEE